MRPFTSLIALAWTIGLVAASEDLYAIEVEDIAGNKVLLDKYRDNAILITNVASYCGRTKSGYTALNNLYDHYSRRGLAVLAFPCNQFGKQEPGTNKQVFKFATEKEGAEFDLFSKIDVNGDNTHPLFQYLKGSNIESNGCEDEHIHCDHWAMHGECEENPEYMKTTCRKSCKECIPSYPFHGDVVWNFESFLIAPKNGLVVHRWRDTSELAEKESINLIESYLPYGEEHMEL